jgi:hypothetical protein
VWDATKGAVQVSIMQKAVTPAQSRAILEHGLDRVAGYVVRRADGEVAVRPDELYRLHALGYPGSPFSPTEAIDVLILPVAPTMRFEDAIGGTDRSDLVKTGGPFLDRPPFLGTGFAPVDRAVPVWWLAPTRVSPGTSLVRFQTTGDPEVLATYVDVATGWQVPGAADRLPSSPSLYVGTLASYEGGHRACDLIGDRVVMFEPESRARVDVPRSEVGDVFELQFLGSWNGLEVRLVDRWTVGGEALARCVYLGHDADLAEGLGLEKPEAGVYELTVPEAQLDGLRSVALQVVDGPVVDGPVATPGT